MRDRLHLWRTLLPSVHIHYAVKTNPSTSILDEVYKSGCSFDCASMAEIDKVLSLGADAKQIIFANPAKTERMIKHALKTGVKWFTFDSVEEAEKIHRLHPDAQLVLRIQVLSSEAFSPMGKKFGVPDDMIEGVL